MKKSKENKLKITQKGKKVLTSVASLGLGIVMLGSLSGCKNNKSVLDDTILENCSVAEIDGSIEIVKYLEVTNKKPCSGPHNVLKETDLYTHKHFKNAITGEAYTNSPDCISFFEYGKDKQYFPRYVTIENIEPISKYLTSDDITKLKNKEFESEDVIALLQRAIESSKEKEKSTPDSYKK